MSDSEIRIDKWLWAVRLFKTRSQAAGSCLGGHVRINDRTVKPSREVHPEDIVRVTAADITRTVRVKGLTDKRVGPKLVGNYLEDLTPPDEYARQKEYWKGGPAQRERGSGRPTKKERRETERFWGL